MLLDLQCTCIHVCTMDAMVRVYIINCLVLEVVGLSPTQDSSEEGAVLDVLNHTVLLYLSVWLVQCTGYWGLFSGSWKCPTSLFSLM